MRLPSSWRVLAVVGLAVSLMGCDVLGPDEPVVVMHPTMPATEPPDEAIAPTALAPSAVPASAEPALALSTPPAQETAPVSAPRRVRATATPCPSCGQLKTLDRKHRTNLKKPKP